MEELEGLGTTEGWSETYSIAVFEDVEKGSWAKECGQEAGKGKEADPH